MFVVCRFELPTPLVGPFETEEEDALAWRDADTKKKTAAQASYLCGNCLRRTRWRAEMTRGEILEAVAGGANLRGANLRGANLSGANLSGATGYRCAGWDPRGYHFRAVTFPQGIQITAGCRCFTLPEARAHWAKSPDALARVELLAMLEE